MMSFGTLFQTLRRFRSTIVNKEYDVIGADGKGIDEKPSLYHLGNFGDIV